MCSGSTTTTESDKKKKKLSQCILTQFFVGKEKGIDIFDENWGNFVLVDFFIIRFLKEIFSLVLDSWNF